MVMVLEWIMVIHRCQAVNAASMMDMVWVRSERRAARVDEAGITEFMASVSVLTDAPRLL